MRVYHPEIDGLRAVAVIAVILFHFHVPGFSGGYVGVDIFFVISGFLISSWVVESMETRTYSLLDFYERRVRRILPALYVVMLATLVPVWFLLLPKDARDFGQSIVATVLFISNILFYNETGYFNPDSTIKPLIHTWSLAVEEQFYIFFPWLAWLSLKGGRKGLAITTGAIALVSFGVAQHQAINHPAAGFFLLPARVWEILLGTWVYLLGQNRWIRCGRETQFSEYVSLLGLTLIVASIALLDAGTPYPSAYTLSPVLGTALLIWFARGSVWVLRALTHRWCLRVGVLSYSAYLWHQPLYAFYVHHTLLKPGWVASVGLIGLVFLFAYVTWRWVETPLRRGSRGRRVILIGMGLTAVLLCLVGYALHKAAGYPDRFSASAGLMAQFKPLRHACEQEIDRAEGETSACMLGPAGSSLPPLLVIGDSHAGMLHGVLQEIAASSGRSMALFSLGGCPVLLGVDVALGNYAPGVCRNLAEQALAYASTHRVEKVLLVGRWSLYTSGSYGQPKDGYFLVEGEATQWNQDLSRQAFERGMERTLRAYEQRGAQVGVLLQVPQQEVAPEKLYAKLDGLSGGLRSQNAGQLLRGNAVSMGKHLELQADSRRIIAAITERVNATSINPDTLFCGDRQCWIGDAEVSWYADPNHLTRAGSQQLKPLLEGFLFGN